MPVIPVRSIPEAAIPAAPRPVQDKTPGWFGTTLLQPMNRRKLNWRLSAILDIARDHEANGNPAGSKEYKSLLQDAETLVDEYGARWNIPAATLDAQLPALRNLRKMAVPGAAKAGGSILWGLVAFLAPVLAGAWTGAFTVAFHWVTKHLGG